MTIFFKKETWILPCVVILICLGLTVTEKYFYKLFDEDRRGGGQRFDSSIQKSSSSRRVSSTSLADEQSGSQIEVGVRKIIAGHSVSEIVPNGSDLSALQFHRKLREALFERVRSDGSFAIVNNILSDLNRLNGSDGQLKNYLSFLIDLESGNGIDWDFFEKVAMVRALEPPLSETDFDRFLSGLGAKIGGSKSDVVNMTSLSDSEKRSFLLGLSQGGNHAVVDLILEDDQANREGMLKIVADQLLEMSLGESMIYFNNVKNKKAREYLLEMGAKKIERAGAFEVAQEWRDFYKRPDKK